MFDIEENLKLLPDSPGVYLHKDRFGEVIYVGKAVSLKKRVRQYFRSAGTKDPKVSAMVSHVAEFEYIVTKTEKEALLLENTLIKKHMPRYNILLRDDKTYPYIKITNEYWPRVLKTRLLTRDGSKYYGPYADVKAVNSIVDFLADVFRLKRCNASTFPPGHRHCLNGDIEKCNLICEGGISHEAYLADIDAAAKFLKGQSKELVSGLKQRMNEASAALDFEKAAQLRDYISSAESVQQKQTVELLSTGSMDIVVLIKGEDEDSALVSVFFVRGDKLSGRETHHMDIPMGADAGEIISAFISQYYGKMASAPSEILTGVELENAELLSGSLSDSEGHSVRVYMPKRGSKRALVKLAEGDAEESVKKLEQKKALEREKGERLLADLVGIAGVSEDKNLEDLRIEAYDISHTGGKDSVGAMVVFRGGAPEKKSYRKFKIRSEAAGDDYAAMQEVIYRRMKRGLEGAEGFAELPDLVLLDGGKGQLSSVRDVMEALGLSAVPVAGMVKDDRHRSRGLVTPSSETDLVSHPELYHLVGVVQEEVHRFAISFHRSKRAASEVRSKLDEIPGIGAARRNALFAAFGSLDAIKAASLDELAAVPGMNAKAAGAVSEHLNKDR